VILENMIIPSTRCPFCTDKILYEAGKNSITVLEYPEGLPMHSVARPGTGGWCYDVAQDDTGQWYYHIPFGNCLILHSTHIKDSGGHLELPEEKNSIEA
jgi:hypothetical protein